MSVYGSIKKRLSSMTLGNDEYMYAQGRLISELTSEERDILAAELDVVEEIRLERGGINKMIPLEECEAAFRAAGIVDDR